MAGAWMADLSWPEVEARLGDGAVVVLPVGAAAKAHGAHLPLDTDWVIARALAEQIADALPVLIAPIVGIGWYPAFQRYPGSQSVDAEIFVSLMVQIVARLVEHGARHIAVINIGVSTEGPLAIAAHRVRECTGVTIHLADIRNLGREARALLKQPGAGGHADEHETSIMLALDPQRVHMERARPEREPESVDSVFRHPVVLDADGDGEERSRLGATGDPTLASAEKGVRILCAMTGDLVDGLRAIFPHLGAAS